MNVNTKEVYCYDCKSRKIDLALILSFGEKMSSYRCFACNGNNIVMNVNTKEVYCYDCKSRKIEPENQPKLLPKEEDKNPILITMREMTYRMLKYGDKAKTEDIRRNFINYCNGGHDSQTTLFIMMTSQFFSMIFNLPESRKKTLIEQYEKLRDGSFSDLV